MSLVHGETRELSTWRDMGLVSDGEGILFWAVELWHKEFHCYGLDLKPASYTLGHTRNSSIRGSLRILFEHLHIRFDLRQVKLRSLNDSALGLKSEALGPSYLTTSNQKPFRKLSILHPNWWLSSLLRFSLLTQSQLKSRKRGTTLLPHRGGKAAGMAIIGHWSIGLVALDFGASEGISHLRMDIARHKKRDTRKNLIWYLRAAWNMLREPNKAVGVEKVPKTYLTVVIHDEFARVYQIIIQPLVSHC
jgi:hypothetical protein